MFRKFLGQADRLLAVAHSVLWMAVMIVWSFAWRVSHGPMGPQFNFAKRFLSRIDGVVSGSIDAISVPIAKAGESALGGDVGLWYTVIFAGLMLGGGTIQWYLTGRLLQVVNSKFGQPSAAILTVSLAVCVTLAGVSWAMSW
jgi:hypothetical protein